MGKFTRHIKGSLPTKISLNMFAVSVIVFALINGVFLLLSRSYFHAAAMDNASEALNAVIARAEHHIRSVENATNVTARMVEENFCPDSLEAYSAKVVQMSSFVSGCSISDRPEMFPQHAVWKDHFADGDAASQMTVSYCRPMYDRKNQVIGVISADMSLPEFSKALSSIRPYPNSYLMILGHDGRYYVHRDTSKIVNKTIFDLTNGRYYSDKLTLGYEMTAGHSGRMHANVAGVHSLICYQPVPGTNWSAALISPERDVLQGYRRLNTRAILIVLAGLLIIFIVCRRTVVKAFAPVKLLEEQTQRIADGDYSTVIARSSENSVVGNLQNSFADMQETLHSHIRDLNAAIEESAKRNEELQTANSTLEDTMRRQSEFVSNMTHQIRTPLNLIMGFSQLLRESGATIPPEEKQSLLNVMDYNTMTLCRMSLMLYDSSDRGYHDEMVSLSFDNVSCNEVARECIGDVNRYFPGVSVKFESELDDSFTMVTDHLYLMRSLREILYNSAKYSDGKNVSLSVSANNHSVRFIFKDTGAGISPEYQKHIFTPFYKPNSLSEGLGVGLPLTKRHVILLGGRLELDPDYRKGCRFIMTFPLDAPNYR